MGATMHMDGSAMSAIVKVAFLFGIFGQDFGTWQAILAIIVAVFSSVAMSGIPGGGGTGELVVCSIFFPDQLAIAVLIGFASNYIAISTVSMSVIWPVYYGTTTGNWTGAAILAIPFVPIFIKHTENFRRISRGEELRLSYLL